MKKKNVYFATVYGRKNFLKDNLLKFFISISSIFRLLIEVIIRKSFGERYFSLSLTIILAILLAYVPYYFARFSTSSYGMSFAMDDISFIGYVADHFTWYLYIGVFLYFARLRYLEVKREPGVYDLKKFSLSTGIINPKFYDIKLLGIVPTSRIISTIYEPGLFLIIGIFLILLHQPLGVLITICSIVYSLSYAGQYYLGDEFMMDKIDSIICTEDLVDTFVKDSDEQSNRGFETYGKKPKDETMRRKLYDSFFEDETDSGTVY